MSITVLGFSGITAAIGIRIHQKAFLAARVRGLLFAAGIASIFSVAPLANLNLIYCAVGYMVFSSSLLIWAFFGLHKNPDAQSSTTVFIGGNSIILSAIVALAYSIAWAPHLLANVYVYALSMMLLLSGIFFVRMVLALASPE